jgi:hypothetical protein
MNYYNLVHSTDVSAVRAASIIRAMTAARTSETSVDKYFTRQYILEDNSELHTRHRENLKSRIVHSSYYQVVIHESFLDLQCFKPAAHFTKYTKVFPTTSIGF